MDMTFITEMYIPMVLAATLVIGYIMKKWINDVDDKWIPTTVCIGGAILACILNHTVDIPTIVSGAISGLASTGLHQVFKQLINH